MAEQDPENAGHVRPSVGRGRTWVLYVSLALNILVVGVVLGAIVTGGPRDARGGRVIVDSPIALIRALEPDARDALRTQLDAVRPDRSQRPFEAARRSRDLLQALRSDPFDPAAFERALVAQSRAMDARNTAGRDALSDVVRAMSVTERRAYADRVEQSQRDRKERGSGDRPSRPPSGG